MLPRKPLLYPPQAGTWTPAFRAVWEPAGPAQLNLASGHDYREGWVNMDRYADRVDVRHDVTDTPWPFPDNHFDRVWANQILEHMAPLGKGGQDGLIVVLQEIQRVLKPGGKAMLGVPWPDSTVDRGNITHYRRFTPYSFHFLEPGSHSTLVVQSGLTQLRLVHQHVIRHIRLGKLWDTSYHTPKWMKRYRNIGRKVGIVFVLEKVA